MHMVNGQYKCEKCGYAVDTFPLFKVHLLSCPLDAWWEKEEDGDGDGGDQGLAAGGPEIDTDQVAMSLVSTIM